MRVKTLAMTLSIIAIAIVAAVAMSKLLLETSDNLPYEAPDFLLTDLQGNVFRLSDFRGRVVVIDFMATWCGPCRLQIPHLQDVRNRYGDLVVIISISIDPIHDSEEVLREFLKAYPHANWIWARDTANLRQVYGITAIPTLIIVDQSGYVKFKHVGLTPSSTLISEIDGLLKRG